MQSKPSGQVLAAGQTVVLMATYAETPGKERRLVKAGGGGLTVRETLGHLKMSLTIPGHEKPIWELSTQGEAGLIFDVEPTEANLRQEAFQDVLDEIERMVIPLFVTDQNAGELPVQTDFETEL